MPNYLIPYLHFPLQIPRAHLNLYSFPTRRSSDLPITAVERADLYEYFQTVILNKDKRKELEEIASFIDEDNIDHLTEHLKDRKSTRLNSSHVAISYAVFCSKKKPHTQCQIPPTGT